jgi:hypothetical protein
MQQNRKRDRRELLVSLGAWAKAASFCLAASNRMEANLSTNLWAEQQIVLRSFGVPRLNAYARTRGLSGRFRAGAAQGPSTPSRETPPAAGGR